MWIEGVWVPQLQRENDKSTMKKITRLKGITKGKLRQVNTVRLWLRVVTATDMANKAGTNIMDTMTSGQWRAGTHLKWSKEYCPKRNYRSIFKRYMIRAFSSQTPPNKPAHYGLELKTKLKKWLNVQRNTWFDWYRSKDSIYLQQEDGNLQVIK